MFFLVDNFFYRLKITLFWLFSKKMSFDLLQDMNNVVFLQSLANAGVFEFLTTKVSNVAASEQKTSH